MRRVYLLRMLCAFALLPVSSLWAQTPLAARIGHTDPSKYTRSRSHNSAGDMACELLVPPSAMDVNLNFMHRCEIMPGGGVGHHRHTELHGFHHWHAVALVLGQADKDVS